MPLTTKSFSQIPARVVPWGEVQTRGGGMEAACRCDVRGTLLRGEDYFGRYLL